MEKEQPHVGCTSSRDVVMLKWRQRIEDFLEAFFMFIEYKMRYLVVSKKKNQLEKEIEKSVPHNHHLSSLVMPIGDPWDGFFYPTLTPMIDSYILLYSFIVVLSQYIFVVFWRQS